MSDLITSLESHQIFVFGSNLRGSHGGGAARQAYIDFGAVMGIGVGPQGQSYAIPTLDCDMNPLPLNEIGHYINQFLTYAHHMFHQQFLVTKIGCGIAGFPEEQMRLLWQHKVLSPNVILPADWTSCTDCHGTGEITTDTHDHHGEHREILVKCECKKLDDPEIDED